MFLLSKSKILALAIVVLLPKVTPSLAEKSIQQGPEDLSSIIQEIEGTLKELDTEKLAIEWNQMLNSDSQHEFFDARLCCQNRA